jgi:hypothetical protein
MTTLSKATAKFKSARKAASSILAQSQVGLPDENTINNLANLIFVFDLEIGSGGPADRAAQDSGQNDDLDRAYNNQ